MPQLSNPKTCLFTLLALALPITASAQQTKSISSLLDFVHRECPIALNDAKAFISKFPQDGPTGKPSVTLSPDQAIVHINGVLDGFEVAADWSDHGSHTMRNCSVKLGPLTATPSDIDTQMRGWFKDNLSIDLNGGAIPIVFADGTGGGFSPRHHARYVTADAIESALGPTFTSIQVTGNYIALSVSVVHPTVPPSE